jgi:hypothetical protein
MSRIRFRLRTALILMAVACVPLGLVAGFIRSVRLQQRAVAELERLGYVAVYDTDGIGRMKSQNLEPVRQAFGRDAVDRVIEVRLAATPSLLGDNTLAKARTSLDLLPHLQTLDLSYSTMSDAGLAALAGLPLQTLTLVHCKYVTLEDPSWLQPLSKLKRLDLRETQVSDDAIASLGQIQGVQTLLVGKTSITREGVAKLRQLVSARQPRCDVVPW